MEKEFWLDCIEASHVPAADFAVESLRERWNKHCYDNLELWKKLVLSRYNTPYICYKLINQYVDKDIEAYMERTNHDK